MRSLGSTYIAHVQLGPSPSATISAMRNFVFNSSVTVLPAVDGIDVSGARDRLMH